MPESLRIITERLLLRSVKLDDAKAIFSYRSDAVSNQFQGWIPKTVNDVSDFLKSRVSSTINVTGTWYQLAIVKKDDRQLIGDIGIHFLDEGSHQVEIGYTLHRNEQGKGYAAEALSGTINYLFHELNKHRITASIDPRNEKSIRLVERLGFRKEAHFRESLLINGEWVDDVVYAILKEEWCELN
jgi:RimJ/RimL family protein N-acetyltransferase